MIARFDILLLRYQSLETAETWECGKKIRTILELFRLWDGLNVMVDLSRTQMTSPACILVEHIAVHQIHDPNLLSYASVCGRAKAVWHTFAQADDEVRLKIKR